MRQFVGNLFSARVAGSTLICFWLVILSGAEGASRLAYAAHVWRAARKYPAIPSIWAEYPQIVMEVYLTRGGPKDIP